MTKQTEVTNLKINKLTQQQYDELVAQDLVSDTEIYLTPDATVTGLPSPTYYLELDNTKIVAWKLPDGGYYCEQSAINYINSAISLPIPYSDDNYNIQLTSPSYFRAEDIGVDTYGIYEQYYDSFSIVKDRDTSPGGEGVHWKTSGYTTEDIEGLL